MEKTNWLDYDADEMVKGDKDALWHHLKPHKVFESQEQMIIVEGKGLNVTSRTNLLQQGLVVLGRLPCLGFVFWLLGAGLWLVVASVGLGAVVLTRFGTRFYAGLGGPGSSVVPAPLAGPTDVAAEVGEESTQAAPLLEAEAESDEGAAPPGDQEDDAALDPGGGSVDSSTTTNGGEQEASSDG